MSDKNPDIDEYETMNRFGYSSDTLSANSGKKIVVRCDYCNEFIEKVMGKYTSGKNQINKNCCSNTTCMKQKRKDVNIKKSGYSSPFQDKEVQKKIKNTMIERYGVEHPLQSKKIHERMKDTNLERYGVENVFQNEDIKSKIQNTFLEKYGVNHPMELQEVRDKIKNSLLKNYGVDSPLKSEEIRQRAVATCIDRFGVDSFAKTNEFVNLMHEMTSKYNGKTLKELAIECNKAYTTFTQQVSQYGLENAMKIDKRRSGIELMIVNWLESENIQFKEQTTIDNYRADFIIEDLILEIDGLYWHSDAVKENNKYHREKMMCYKKHNYKTLFIRENEILNSFDIVKSIIKNKLGLSNKIHARKCNIVKINKNESKEFLNLNHLMGYGRGQSYGIIYNKEIVGVMQIKRKNLETFEISRFCTIVNQSIIGGFSKLLKFIYEDIQFKQLINFVDLRYGLGKYLEALGFIKNKEYLSFRWTDFTNVFHRMKFPNNSGYENGLFKIWDCGQMKYTLIKS